ncbi:hypothetical protein AJ80_06504 [Polytolypa hystricis UAMH7299]|uniref:Adenylate cyclase n=1 Tax=Polytolypa hystricis (strain UAMH7299) TaxID=1447883 RepID=A0A2B7XVI2_POLH7|nr:hypothetical protein AJ80_06504 [Polytolypa hystricis UAMH7299]
MARRRRESDQDITRHGSESSTNSNGSFLSQETVKMGPRGSGSGTAPLEKDNGKDRAKRPPQTISLANLAPPTYLRSPSPDISPTDVRNNSAGFGNHRKALAVLGAGGMQKPIPSRIPPSKSAANSSRLYPSQSSTSSPMLPNSAQGTFFNDSSEFETSPAFRPTGSRTNPANSPDLGFEDDRRRPSIASATTVSSNGSKSSRSGSRFHKRLQGFFGDEYNKFDVPMERTQSQRTPSINSRAASSARERNNSLNSLQPLERTASPSRPLTPLPSSDVTPWMYQRFNDIPHYGDAPIRPAPTDPDIHRYAPIVSKNGSKESRRLHLPGHRNSRSREGKDPSIGSNGSSRPNSGREEANLLTRRLGSGITPASSSTNLGARSASPTSSLSGGHPSQRSPNTAPSKRTLLDKLRPNRKAGISKLKELPSSARSLHDPLRAGKLLKRESSPVRRGRNGSFDTNPSGRQWEPIDYDRKKDGKDGKLRHHRFPFRHESKESDKERERRDTFDEEHRVFHIDTDFSNLENIVNQIRSLSPTDNGGIYTGGPVPEDKERELKNPHEVLAGDWHAPESWAVKKLGADVVGRLPELSDEDASMSVDQDGRPYCVRIFRIDSTFATLSSGLNTTVTDILEMLGRKSFLQDDLNNYEIVLRKNDLSRTLEHGERPILMQKRLLEQAGYKQSDRIADIGREDNSYLCSFTFLPTKLSGYSSLDVDPGFNKNQKFSHVDLQGRSLITIPITLYRKAPEIISLNLSRNLALDVPKDFIQSCINLREIKYISNEAWRLPSSFSLASRLTYLDISNNRLEQLEHAELHRLRGLVSVKMANNKLSGLPSYFGEFTSLRSLNISSNNFRVFPDFLCNLKSLVDLDISFNKITDLPRIGKLKSLERLWVTNNALRGPLGETFRTLSNLKEIDARFNEITSIDNIALLPRLEQLLVGHNKVTTFSGTFMKLRTLVLDHCPVTEFDLIAQVPTLTSLNIASAKLVQFKDTLFSNMPNLTKLVLNKNHFVTLSTYIGTLRRLEHFSIAKNPLSTLPHTIGCLTELKNLNLRECNLSKLPPEIWYCSKLETLNISSNVLDSFPRPAAHPPPVPTEAQLNGITPASTPGLSTSPSYEELGRLEDFEARRPSQASGGLLSVGSSPGGGTHRKGSIASLHGSLARKASITSRAPTDGSTYTRKDSNWSQKVANTFAPSLRHLAIADNRLEDDIFQQLALLVELRVLNLSYNVITEIPPGLVKRWPYLVELYLSGNELSALPSDDLEESSYLKVLHINGNKFQVLPAELCKVNRLAILDVGSNALKYNVSNWPYDWNWNWNHNLKYLNFSGNKRFEVKPSTSYVSGVPSVNGTDLTNFNSLNHLRVLGLMDVTLTIPTIPDQTEDRRVRTSASLSGSITYGMADSLGRTEHLSMIDMVVPRFRGNEMETLIGLFDGQASMSTGSKVAKFLHETFSSTFTTELKRLRPGESASDALRRSFLALNKDMATAAYRPMDDREPRQTATPMSAAAKVLNRDDAHIGGVATILYLHNLELYAANVGDAQAVLVQSSGQFKFLTTNHDPAESNERERIREAGGFVSRNGKLNDHLSVSRAFGYFHMMPAVMAAPNTLRVTLTDQDEMIIIASGELWNFVTPDVVVDVARADRGDPMIASQKIRDLAIAYGATNKIMVMIAGVTDLKRRERSKLNRTTSVSMGMPLLHDEIIQTKRGKRLKEGPGDSRLARLDRVEAPTGELAIIFTDIKMSTSLWETYPVAMRSAIQIHNELFRRQLSIIGGFEVKTEGDAFMVSFSTASAALLWCFTCQAALLEAPWPQEILQTPPCREQYDADGNLIYRGLSVRMGIHWGRPVCEKDTTTGRMDYFGPMVNRASRIAAVADGGEIFVSSDFVAEIQRSLENLADYERTSSAGSEEAYSEDIITSNIRRELYQLSSQGFEVKDMGERKLKGLENPEFVYLMYPHSLASRLTVQRDMSDKAKPAMLPIFMGPGKKSSIEAELVWRLWKVSLRLEGFCSALENSGPVGLREPDTGLLDTIKGSNSDILESEVMALIEHQVTRIETCANTLTIRHMIKPLRPGDTLEDHAMPMADILKQLQAQLTEFRVLKEQMSAIPTPPLDIVRQEATMVNGASDDSVVLNGIEPPDQTKSSLDEARIKEVDGDEEEEAAEKERYKEYCA